MSEEQVTPEKIDFNYTFTDEDIRSVRLTALELADEMQMPHAKMAIILGIVSELMKSELGLEVKDAGMFDGPKKEEIQ